MWLIRSSTTHIWSGKAPHGWFELDKGNISNIRSLVRTAQKPDTGIAVSTGNNEVAIYITWHLVFYKIMHIVVTCQVLPWHTKSFDNIQTGHYAINGIAWPINESWFMATNKSFPLTVPDSRHFTSQRCAQYQIWQIIYFDHLKQVLGIIETYSGVYDTVSLTHTHIYIYIYIVTIMHQAFLLRAKSKISICIRAWIVHFIHVYEWDVITDPFRNFNGDLIKPPLKLRNG